MKKANFTCRDSHGDELKYVYQWDTNRRITIEFILINDQGDTLGHSGTVYFHFCNHKSSKAFVIEGEAVKTYTYQCTIPNELLMEPDDIKIYATETQELSSENRTLATLVVPVIQRPMPPGYVFQNDVHGAPVADDLSIHNDYVQLSLDGNVFGDGAYV